MNKKKYMVMGVFAGVIVLGAGVVYYFDAGVINDSIGIDSARIDAISDADLSAVDSASSSLPSQPLAEKIPQKKTQEKNIVKGSLPLAAQGENTPDDFLNGRADMASTTATTSPLKQTLERDADGVGAPASALPSGTSSVENSAGPPPAQYKLMISFQGAGMDSILSDPAGLTCAESCTGSYASGTRVTLTPVPGKDSVFESWSGLCYGETTCLFTIARDTSLTANFRSTLVLPSSVAIAPSVETSTDPMAPASSSASASSSSAPSDHVLIAAVQIAGASSTNDIVKLYNPTAETVDLSGWKLRKKSQTGTDYSLKVFPTGSIVASGQSFTWANSAGGFSESVGANVSSTETLSVDNSIALMDASGNVIDSVAWGTGTGQYGEGPPYPTNPIAGQTLVRQSADGVMADTDNNTNDFTLQ